MAFKMATFGGHGKNVSGTYDPGACANGFQEATLARELANLVDKEAKRRGIACDVLPDRNYYSYFKNGGKFDFTPYNYVLEIHFNASGKIDAVGDGSKKGSMFYIHENESGHSVEDKILANLYAIGSVKAWDGVVVSQRQYNGGLLVQNRVRSQGVSHGLLETCFITDADDMKWYQDNKGQIAEAIIDGIIDGFGLSAEKAPAFKPYLIKVDVSEIYDHVLNVREKPDADSKKTMVITKDMTLTIIGEAKDSKGNTWGKLKSEIGWLNLHYVKRV